MLAPLRNYADGLDKLDLFTLKGGKRQTAYRAVHRLWVKQAERLASEDGGLGVVNLSLWKRCPYSWRREGMGFFCQAVRICPFCWERRTVFNVCEQLVRGCRLEVRDKCVSLLESQWETNSREPLEYHLEAATATLDKVATLFRNGRRAVGGGTMATIEPVGLSWLTRFRVFAFVGEKEPKLPGDGEWSRRQRLKGVRGMKQIQIAATTARLCQYPAGLLLEPAEQVWELLATTASSRQGYSRWRRSYGVCRN